MIWGITLLKLGVLEQKKPVLWVSPLLPMKAADSVAASTFIGNKQRLIRAREDFSLKEDIAKVSTFIGNTQRLRDITNVVRAEDDTVKVSTFIGDKQKLTYRYQELGPIIDNTVKVSTFIGSSMRLYAWGLYSSAEDDTVKVSSLIGSKMKLIEE